MRVRRPVFGPRFKPDLDVAHDRSQLTGFGGLMLLARFLRSVGVVAGLKRTLSGHRTSGDYDGGSLATLVLLFLCTGGRRLSHLVQYFAKDALLLRLAGLRVMPSKATLSRWLAGFRMTVVAAMAAVNRALVVGHLRRVGLTTQLTLDLDGTVSTTRGRPERSAKGFNPTRKGARSYHPLTLHIAETGQFYAVKNRPGNVADIRGARSFMHEHLRELQNELPLCRLVVRQDSAFFDNKQLQLYEQMGVSYVGVARMYEDLALVINKRKHWRCVREGVHAFEFRFQMKSWDCERCFVAYRFRLSDVEIERRRGEQLKLFEPNDVQYRYRLYVTNLDRDECDTEVLHTFYGGRGGQEKDIGELKTDFAFSVFPSRKYAGNAAWQTLSTLAYNATIAFNTEIIHGDKAPEHQQGEHRTASKATRLFRHVRAATLRFIHLNIPGQLVNRSGRSVLRLPQSRAREDEWKTFAQRLDALADPARSMQL